MELKNDPSQETTPDQFIHVGLLTANTHAYGGK